MSKDTLKNLVDPRRQLRIGALAAVTLAAGCFGAGEEIDTHYGRSRGADYSSSVNGTGVLVDMIKAQNIDADINRKLTPRIDNYDTIIWIPDDWNPPSQQVIDRFDQWLTSGIDRALIFVGRDFESQIDYWRKIGEQSSGQQRERVQRQLAHAVIDLESTRSQYDLAAKCDWFEMRSTMVDEKSPLGGPWSDDADENLSAVCARTDLSPPSGSYQVAYEVEELLSAGGNPFAFSLSKPDWDGGRVFVISNGSFLLNLPLVNRANRRLAGHVVEISSFDERVLFLESGPGPIEISQFDAAQHTMWGWIAQPPLRYIVPHFLFLGVLFCFAFFPIFGRPQRLSALNFRGFRNHVCAVGRLMARGKQPDHAQRKIQQWRELQVADHSPRKQEKE